MYKFGQIVRVKEGFYKGHRGVITGKDEVHIDGIPGREARWSYQIALVVGEKAIQVEIDEKDLKPETIEEIRELLKETQEDIENQTAIENPEEQLDDAIENPEEQEPKEKK